MRRHRLRVLQSAAGFEIRGDAGRPEDVDPSFPFKPASAVRRRTIS